MRSNQPISSLQAILDEEAKIAVSRKRERDNGVHSGISAMQSLAITLIKKLKEDQLKALEAYVIANYHYRYRRGAHHSNKELARVDQKWNAFLALIETKEEQALFNKIRKEFDSYQRKLKNLHPQFELFIKTFGLHSTGVALEQKQTIKPTIESKLVKAQPATVQVESGLAIAATKVDRLAVDAAPKSSALNKPAKEVAENVKKMLMTEAKPLAQAQPATVQVESGLAIAATKVDRLAVEAAPKSSALNKPVKEVVNAIENLVKTEKVVVQAPKTEPVIEIPSAPPVINLPVAKPVPVNKAKKDQEALDREYALQLQAEFDQEEKQKQQQVNDDHLLAMKLQIEEEVKEEIIFPSIKAKAPEERLDIATAEKVAGDIYRRGLADLKRAMPTPAAKKLNDNHDMQAASYYLEAYYLQVFVQTANLQMTIIAAGLIIQSAYEIQAAEKSKQQGMYRYASQFSMFSVSTPSYQASYQHTSFEQAENFFPKKIKGY